LLKRVAREPVVHFVAIGAVLFVLTNLLAGTRDPRSYRIVVSAGQVESLVAAFARSWKRPPTPAELRGLVDEQVRQEVYFREAMALGLDKDDPVVLRRLRQKMEFVAAEASGDEAPAEAQQKLYERLRARYDVVIEAR
jgi:hypothetical protein